MPVVSGTVWPAACSTVKKRKGRMTFYPEGPDPGTPAPRLPERGWLPDPSEMHLERLWDGFRWTERTRDRVTKVESPPPGMYPTDPRSAGSYGAGRKGAGSYGGGAYGSGTYSSGSYGSGTHNSGSYGSGSYGGGPRDWSPSTSPGFSGPRDWSPQPPRRRFRAWRMVGFSVLMVLGITVVYQYVDRAGETSSLAEPIAPGEPGIPAQPGQRPSLDVDSPPVDSLEELAYQTTPADIDYPVFGSTELVTHLEAGMIAQQPNLDVSSWAQAHGFDAISEALLEAGTQNPYLYVSGWEAMQQGDRVEIRPAYIYDDGEAERRRSETARAAANGLIQAGVHGTMSDQEKVTLIHDYIADIAEYDKGAFDAIEDGEATPRVHQSQEAYGILVMGTAVCNGYAMAFAAMAEQAGLETVTVTGSDSAAATGGSHAWNKVLVDEQWLLVDVTWNDPSGWDGGALRDYLMIEDHDPILDTRTVGNDWVVSQHLGNYSS